MGLWSVISPRTWKFYSGVVIVNSIEPDYYAAGTLEPTFSLSGLNFDLVPEGSFAFIATSNELPEQFKNQTSSKYRSVIGSHDNVSMQITFPGLHEYSGPFYLGCIMSPDLMEVLWSNDTAPLP